MTACHSLPSPEPLPELPDLSTNEARVAYVSQHPQIEERVRQRIESGDLVPGLSVIELVGLLGNPHVTALHDHANYDETWTYYGYAVGIVFFLSNGRLVSWREESYHNPFSPTLDVGVPLPRAQKVSAVVYNLNGIAVDTLANGALPGGYNRLTWNPRPTRTGDPLPAGVYIVHVVTEDTTLVRKLVLVR
jgi:hypothetical protein